MLEAKDLQMIGALFEEKLEQKLEEKLEKKLAPIHADIRELKKDVGELKEDVAELKTDVAVLKEDVAELKQNVTVLQEDVSTLKTNTFRLEQNLIEINDNLVKKLDRNHNLIELTYVTGCEAIAKHDQDIEVLEGKVISIDKRLIVYAKAFALIAQEAA